MDGGEVPGLVEMDDRGEKEREGGSSEDVLAVEDCRRRNGTEREGRR